MIVTKICSCCGEAKPLDQFAKDKNRKDGLQPYCRTCVSEKNKQYREFNKRRNNSKIQDAYNQGYHDGMSAAKNMIIDAYNKGCRDANNTNGKKV